MDAVLRALRKEPTAGGDALDSGAPAVMAVVIDNLDCAGGRDVMQTLVDEYLLAQARGHCQASRTVLLQLDGSITTSSAAPELARPPMLLLDAWTDPAGWLRDAGMQAATVGPGSSPLRLVTITGPAALHGLTAAAVAAPEGAEGGPGPRSTALVIDNLSVLAAHHPAPAVLSWLERLRYHPAVSCVIAAVQQDALPSAGLLAGLERMASCTLGLSTLPGLQQEVAARVVGQAVHATVSCSFKSRKTGRVHVETSLLSLMTGPGGGGLRMFIQPPAELAGLMSPGAIVALAVHGRPAAETATAAGTAASAGGMAAVQAAPEAQASSMRLVLTEEERRARQAVVLPFEHKGAGSAYRTGDWKDYLPIAAGGRSSAPNHSMAPPAKSAPASEEPEAQGGQLGSILYTRDSDEEAGGLHDSDEDPDDDLTV